MANFKRHVTCQFTNNICNITGREGYRQIAIKNMASSLGDIEVRGDAGQTIGGLDETAIILKPNDILNIGDENINLDIDGITITAGSNATCQLIGIRYITN
jgi:hypothetical protein